MCVTGETDRASLLGLAPFWELIPTDCIVGVTREKQFAGHLINENTEVVFMYEWSNGSLNAEDAKKVSQGGLLMLPRKHKETEKFAYNSGFYITTNEMQILGRDLTTGQLNTGFTYAKLYPFLIHATEYQTGYVKTA